MREIKFRAWYEEGGYIMLTWEQLKSEADFSWFIDEELAFMQYTGLKDKNGIGIFEKDIVKIRVDDGFDYIDGIGFVDWYEKKREYAIFSKGEPWIPLSIKGEFEVIGNIYQNKDLLRKRNEKRLNTR